MDFFFPSYIIMRSTTTFPSYTILNVKYEFTKLFTVWYLYGAVILLVNCLPDCFIICSQASN